MLSGYLELFLDKSFLDRILDHLIGKLVQALRAEFCLRMAAINLCGSGLVLLPVITVIAVI